MKQTAAFISAYSSDTFGICSALYELGGMSVMHDASGCNSTYHTHDEPRAYFMDSAVFVTAVDETAAVLGADEAVVEDIVTVATEIEPAFIAICGTPIPMVTGVDFNALATMCEQRTGIPSFGFATDGMHSYLSGIAQAYQALARRFVEPCSTKIPMSVNILGATPLDFSLNGQIESITAWLVDNGFSINSCWSMNSSLEQIKKSAQANVNLVISSAALTTAKILEKQYHIPYVVGVPYGIKAADALATTLKEACQSGISSVSYKSAPTVKADIAIIGESVTSASLAYALYLEKGLRAQVLCPLESSPELLREHDTRTPSEDALIDNLKAFKTVIADDLYQPLIAKNSTFYSLPHEAFSGRMYHDKMPNLINKPL